MKEVIPIARHVAEPGMEDDLKQRPEARRIRRATHFGVIMLLLALPGLPAMAQDEEQLVRVDSVQEQPMTQTVEVIGRLVPRRAGSVAARHQAPDDLDSLGHGLLLDAVDANQLLLILRHRG